MVLSLGNATIILSAHAHTISYMNTPTLKNKRINEQTLVVPLKGSTKQQAPPMTIKTFVRFAVTEV